MSNEHARLIICPPHLTLRFRTGDLLRGVEVVIGDEFELGRCTDCDQLDDTPYGPEWAQRETDRWRR